jgi:hypothetical protein
MAYSSWLSLCHCKCGTTPCVNVFLLLQVQNYMRRVLSVSLQPVASSCPSMSVLALHIKGTAFLWHQVSHPQPVTH